jgi:hypothetical protein
MNRFLPIAVATALILVAGLLHGLWTDRWSLSDEPAASAALLETMPLEKVGSWTMAKLDPLPPQDLAIGEIKGYLNRSAVDKHTGEAVTLLMVCGRPGPIAVHTPDVCFGGAGYDLLDQSKKTIKIGGSRTIECWVGQFRKSGTLPSFVEIYWTWSSDGRWLAPDEPRMTFAGERRLFKLYAIRSLARGDLRRELNPIEDFLSALVPELDRRLFPPVQ